MNISKEKVSATDLNRTTIDGRKITLTKDQAKVIGTSKICIGGCGEGSDHGRGPHRFTAPKHAVWYENDDSTPIAAPIMRKVFLTKQQARELYWCVTCGSFLGCWSCIRSILVAEFWCMKCDWYATKYGFLQHGKRVMPMGLQPPEPEIIAAAVAQEEKKSGMVDKLLMGIGDRAKAIVDAVEKKMRE